MQSVPAGSGLWHELMVFLVFCLLVWPLVAAGLACAWGFARWIHLALAAAPGAA